MKVKDIAKQLGLDGTHFATWLTHSRFSTTNSGWQGLVLDPHENVEEVVAEYQAFVAEGQARRDAEAQEQLLRDQEKQRALASMLITSGFSFDGYTITKYSGYISGDDAVSMDRPSHGWLGGVHGDVGADLLAALVHIRRRALNELKEAALALDCNAVVGVDFDYITLDPETVNNQGGTLYLPFLFAVTANGNAVVIEKN